VDAKPVDDKQKVDLLNRRQQAGRKMKRADRFLAATGWADTPAAAPSYTNLGYAGVLMAIAGTEAPKAATDTNPDNNAGCSDIRPPRPDGRPSVFDCETQASWGKCQEVRQ
jgi:hypothetical protein